MGTYRALEIQNQLVNSRIQLRGFFTSKKPELLQGMKGHVTS